MYTRVIRSADFNSLFNFYLRDHLEVAVASEATEISYNLNNNERPKGHKNHRNINNWTSIIEIEGNK